MSVIFSKRGNLSKLQHVWNRIVIFKDWYKLVFPFNRIFSGTQKLHLRNGKSVYVRDVRSCDTNIVRDILWGNEYALQKMSLPQHSVVFDLGANIGTFCIEIRHILPSAQITAYEPHPDNFRMLKMNAPFATLVQKAVTGKTETVHLENSDNFYGLQVIPKGGILVESLSLDDILKDVAKVDLLKIDIEGSEYDLLNAAAPQTFAKVQRIIMETHDIPGFDDVKWAETILAENGLKTSWIDSLKVIYGEKV